MMNTPSPPAPPYAPVQDLPGLDGPFAPNAPLPPSYPPMPPFAPYGESSPNAFLTAMGAVTLLVVVVAPVVECSAMRDLTKAIASKDSSA